MIGGCGGAVGDKGRMTDDPGRPLFRRLISAANVIQRSDARLVSTVGYRVGPPRGMKGRRRQPAIHNWIGFRPTRVNGQASQRFPD